MQIVERMWKPRTFIQWVSLGLAGVSVCMWLANTLLLSFAPGWVGVLGLLLGATWAVILLLGEATSRGKGARGQILVTLGFAALFCFSFLLCAYWMFPYERITRFVIQEVERPEGRDHRRRPSGLELQIGSLRPSWVTGVELTDVQLTKRADNADDEPAVVQIDEMSARVSLLALLGGSLDVTYELDLGWGTIDGEYRQSEDQTALLAHFDRVDLGHLGMLRTAVGLPVRGQLNGKIDLTLAQEAADTKGSIDLTIRRLTVGDGEAKLRIGPMSEGITIEEIDVGTVTMSMEVQDGVARLQELSADGDDIALSGSGTIHLARDLKMSRLDLLVRFKFGESYRERNDRTRGLFTLLDMAPQLRPARTPDGALQYRINGAFGSRLGTTPAGRARAPDPGG